MPQAYKNMELKSHPLYDAADAERKAVLDANPGFVRYFNDATGLVEYPEPNTNVRTPPSGGIASFLDTMGSIESKLTPISADSYLAKNFTLIHDTPLTALTRGLATEIPYLGRAIGKLGTEPENITLDEIRDLSLGFGGSGMLSSSVANKSGGATLGMFVNPSKAGVSEKVIEKARNMRKEGASADEIWNKTKLTVDDSGLLMKEISDKEFMVNIPAAKEVTRKIFGKEFKTEMLDSQPVRNYILELLGFKYKDERAYPSLYAKDSSSAEKYREKDFKLKPVSNEVGQYKLGDIVSHPELFKLYPELKHVAFQDQPQSIFSSSTIQGSYRPEMRTNTSGMTEEELKPYIDQGLIELEVKPEVIKVKPDLTREEFKDTALHEIQHYIQEHEGFAQGGNKVGTEFGDWISPQAEKKVEDFNTAFLDGVTPLPSFQAITGKTSGTQDWLDNHYEPWRASISSPSFQKALSVNFPEQYVFTDLLSSYPTWDSVPEDIARKLTLDKKGKKLEASYNELHPKDTDAFGDFDLDLETYFMQNWKTMHEANKVIIDLIENEAKQYTGTSTVSQQAFEKKWLESEMMVLKFLDSGRDAYEDLKVGGEIYKKLSGEVVSRVVEARKDLSPDEILANNPLIDFDKIMPEKDRIYPLSSRDFD